IIRLEPEEVAQLSEETVCSSLEMTEAKFLWLGHCRAVTEIGERPGNRPIAEEPVCRELVRLRSGIEHTIHEKRVAVAIDERRPRPRCALSYEPEENRTRHLVLDLQSRDRLG